MLNLSTLITLSTLVIEVPPSRRALIRRRYKLSNHSNILVDKFSLGAPHFEAVATIQSQSMLRNLQGEPHHSILTLSGTILARIAPYASANAPIVQ